jgi:hypothetical protein
VYVTRPECATAESARIHVHVWHRQAVELDVEISRERVPLRNAYRHVGQQAVVRVNSGEEYTLQGGPQLDCWQDRQHTRLCSCRRHVTHMVVVPMTQPDLVPCSVVSAVPAQHAAAAAVPCTRRPDRRRDQGCAGAHQRDRAAAGERLAGATWWGAATAAHMSDCMLASHTPDGQCGAALLTGAHRCWCRRGRRRTCWRRRPRMAWRSAPSRWRPPLAAPCQCRPPAAAACRDDCLVHRRWVLSRAPKEVTRLLQGAGLNLRGDIIGTFRYRTILIMCEGLAIGTAKALIEADSSVGGLNFPLRENVVLYYRVSKRGGLMRRRAGVACMCCTHPHNACPA